MSRLDQTERSIAFVSFGDPKSTLSLRARELAKSLEAFRWKTRVFYCTRKNIKKRHNTSTGRQASLFSTAMEIRRWNPEFVHFLNPMSGALFIAKLMGKRLVIGDWEDWHSNPENPSDRRLVNRIADRYWIRNADVAITCSHWLQQHFAKRWNRDVRYLPYACYPVTDPNPDAASPYRDPTAVFMGSLHPHWNHRVVLEAAKKLSEQGLFPSIEIIGGGSDLESCQRFIADHHLSNVSMLGRLPDEDMLLRLKHAHVLLFPFEDNLLNRARCPLKVFHYAAAKRPIITSPVGEVAKFLGNRADYCDSSIDAFAEAIYHAMTQPRRGNIDYGIEKETWSVRAEQLNEILMRVPANSRPI